MIHVTAQGGTGQGYDLTDRISGLRFSNSRPGGDESCTFTYHRDWQVSAPEVDRFNLVRITYGIDTLWVGRIAERDRGGENNEQIAVTAYGLGVRLKDATFQEIFVDRDFGAWQDPTVARKIAIATNAIGSHSVEPDQQSGQPSLRQSLQGAWAGAARDEVFYYANGIFIGSIYYAWKRGGNISSGDTAWEVYLYASPSGDDLTGSDSTADLHGAGPGTGTLTATGGNKDWIAAQLYYPTAAGSAGFDYDWLWTVLAIYGTHGLTKRGSESATQAKGFYASDVVPYLADLAAGITIRRVDATTFVIEQSAFKEPTTHEDGIEKTNGYHSHERTWGTWGPDSPLDTSTDGYFDYTALEPTTQHWFTTRENCDDLDLHDEDSTLFNVAKVHYTDTSGASQIVTRTASVPELDAAGITREKGIDAGTLTTAMAQQLGDVALALFGGFAPARGSVTLSRPIRHYQRGELPPCYMRADGANLRISDILPSVSLFELTSAPDRRTTMPIKRVDVDCSGAVPRVTAELDQGIDALDALLARFAQDAALVGV